MSSSFIAVLLLCVVCTTLGFRVQPSRASSFALSAKKSVALPFINAPAKLDGSAVGDYGFDPLGFTDTLQDLNYVKVVTQAEIKHGRVAMLATVGFVFQQFVHFASPEANPLKATVALGYGPNLQVLFAIGCIELATWKQTFEGKSTPGDFSFDPMGQLKGKSEKQVADLKLKELKNGRLAMVGIMGMVFETLIFGKLAIF